MIGGVNRLFRYISTVAVIRESIIILDFSEFVLRKKHTSIYKTSNGKLIKRINNNIIIVKS